jgi:hypothetical protein
MEALYNTSIEIMMNFSKEPVIKDCMIHFPDGGVLINWTCLRNDLVIQFNHMYFWLAIFFVFALFLKYDWNRWISKYMKNGTMKEFIHEGINIFPDVLGAIICVFIIYYGGIYIFT